MASIRERRRSDGTVAYAVLWRVPGPDGMPTQTSLTFDEAALAERAKAIIEATGANAEQVAALLATAGPGYSVDDAMCTHVKMLTGVTDRTRHDYLRDYQTHIQPVLGALPVQALTRDHVATWLNSLDKRQPRLSDKTIANLHGLLSAAVASAAARGWRDGNPCRGLRLPERDFGEEEMVFLSREEWAMLYEQIPAYWRPFYAFIAGTGCRWSEAVGLTVGMVDLDAAVARLLQSDKRGAPGQKRALGSTKSRRGRRPVTLPAQLVELLRPLVEGRGPEEYVFTTRLARSSKTGKLRGGRPIPRSNYEQVWMPAIQRAQDRALHGDRVLKQSPRVHDLRHTHASWLILAGIDLMTVSRRLGHESITTTVDLYGHLGDEEQRRAADVAGQALEGGQATPAALQDPAADARAADVAGEDLGDVA